MMLEILFTFGRNHPLENTGFKRQYIIFENEELAF